MITIFHLEASQSERVIWLMEELALPYRLERFAREADGAAPPAYRALHPFGTAPVIRDGDRVIAESAAIVEYICRVHGGGRLIVGPDEPGYADYLQAMHLNAAIQGALFVRMAHGGAADGDDAPIIVRACRRREDGYFRYLEARLGEAPYLGGAHFSGADIMLLHNLTVLPQYGGRTIDDLPNTREYVARVSARHACVRAAAIASGAADPPAAAG